MQLKLKTLLAAALFAASGFAHSIELIRVGGEVGWSCYTGTWRDACWSPALLPPGPIAAPLFFAQYPGGGTNLRYDRSNSPAK
jgi:hypothetical protein